LTTAHQKWPVDGYSLPAHKHATAHISRKYLKVFSILVTQMPFATIRAIGPFAVLRVRRTVKDNNTQMVSAHQLTFSLTDC
jgi:hypothetical protein